ncbi:L-malate glycosyltransferase [Candidatus Hakubella thermalkaliphila]|uniref:L-malate glycosyltransferase n=1 Tax=Candidatus Hakubella thermalkaliphila TaxID=2754717 RepID=A0A6V8P0Q0_9ACTN|nr:L-malate glycosyltransferase [Candidatus Hakubella thermalkaliphila]GFP43063.1 L-malate glycosyltransferase [Candidatus Hakubella thermalkaliphila]
MLPAHYYLSDKYGTEPSWGVEIVNRLGEKGHKVFAVAGVAELSKPLHPNVQLHTLYAGPRSRNTLVELWRKVRFSLACWTIGRRILSQHPIDVIHHIAPVSPNSFNLLAAFSRSDIPFIMGPAMLPSRTFSRYELAAWLGTKANFLSQVGEGLLAMSATPCSWLFRRTISNCDRFVCATEGALRYYERYMDKGRMAAVPVGIDVGKFHPPSRRERRTLIILAVAYLTRRKGIDLLLKALAQVRITYPRVRLVVAGDGPERDPLEGLASQLGLQAVVRFLGHIEHRSIGGYYRKADIFCSPTLYEPFGQTILEAMASGLPVVASRVGAIPDLVTEDLGILFTKGDVRELAGALETLIGDEQKRVEMGKKARQRAESHYDWSQVVDRYLAIYQSTMRTA